MIGYENVQIKRYSNNDELTIFKNFSSYKCADKLTSYIASNVYCIKCTYKFFRSITILKGESL